MVSKAWSEAENDLLRVLWAKGDTVKAIAATIGRSIAAVKRQRAVVGLPPRSSESGIAIGFEEAQALREGGLSWAKIGAKAGVSGTSMRDWYSKQCGLRGIAVVKGPVAKPAPSPVVKPRLTLAYSRPPEPVMLALAAPKAEPVEKEEIKDGILYADLTRDQCAHPLNDRKPWRMCGKPVMAGRVYCARHCALNYGAVKLLAAQ